MTNITNQLYTDECLAQDAICNNHDQLPPIDGVFLGHRFVDDELQIVLGRKIGNQYQIAATISHQEAQLLSERLAVLLHQVEEGQEPLYSNPTTIPFPPPAFPDNGTEGTEKTSESN